MINSSGKKEFEMSMYIYDIQPSLIKGSKGKKSETGLRLFPAKQIMTNQLESSGKDLLRGVVQLREMTLDIFCSLLGNYYEQRVALNEMWKIQKTIK
jgi:hypothetical protein